MEKLQNFWETADKIEINKKKSWLRMKKKCEKNLVQILEKLKGKLKKYLTEIWEEADKKFQILRDI